MFESLDEHMKHDDKEASSKKERAAVWVGAAIVCMVLLGGLYVSVSAIH